MLTLSIIIAGALVWLSANVQHIGNLSGIGAKWVMSDRSQAVRDDGFVGRSARTLRNNLESCAMYVPSALTVFVLYQSSSVIAVTAGVTPLLARSLPCPTGSKSTRFDRPPGWSA